MSKNTKSASKSSKSSKPAASKKPAPKAKAEVKDATKKVTPAEDTAPVTASKPAPRPAIPEVKESTAEHPTKLVWDIADKMHQRKEGARRSDVIRACVEAGIALNTAKTQYQRWFSAKKVA